MNDALFGLSAESRSILDRYLQWTHLASDGLRRGVNLDASNHQVGNILQETYTQAELKDILSGQTAMLLHSIDARLKRFAASSAELLRAVLRDADRQRVTIEVDVNAVLNVPPASTTTNSSVCSAGSAATGLLMDHERQLLGGPRGHLAPLTVADADGEAGRQLSEAREEIHRLQEKVHRLTDAYAQVMSVRSADTEKLLSMQDELLSREAAAAQMTAQPREQDGGLRQKVEELSTALAAAKRELGVRLNQSIQYQEMKRILAQKNGQIRKLREHLMRYDPAFLQTDNGAGDTMIEEDD